MDAISLFGHFFEYFKLGACCTSKIQLKIFGWFQTFFQKMRFSHKNACYRVLYVIKPGLWVGNACLTTNKLPKNVNLTKNWPSPKMRVNKYVKPLPMHRTRTIPGI